MINKEKAWTLIKDFHRQYRQVPCTGFLAGYFKVSLEAIRNLLISLEREGKVIRDLPGAKGVYRTKYRIK